MSRSAKSHWTSSSSQQVCLKGYWKVFAILQGVKESVWMDGWVSVRIRRTQGVSYNKSIVDPVQTRWGTIPLPSSFSSCSELGLSHRRRKGTKAYLLHQQSFKRSWRKIPPLIEKLAFSLITTIRKLRPYFQAHIINVLTDHPLKKATNKLEAVGRLI